MLSLQDYRQYRQNRGTLSSSHSNLINIHILTSLIARYAENNFSVLRSKISELHPNHKASLGALLRHLLRVASHSDENAMTVEALASQFCYTILRGNAVVEGGVHAKAGCDDFVLVLFFLNEISHRN